jgi:glycosyltransferase involved in cell wall biosynthesis
MQSNGTAAVPKRIVFLINSLAVGGAEKVFLTQANALFHRGWDVYFITLFHPGALIAQLDISEDHVVCIESSSVFDVGALMRLIQHLKRISPDSIYTTLNEANTMGRLARFFVRARLYTREANMADIKPFLYKTIDILIGFQSHAIIAVSEAVARSLQSYAPWQKSRMRVLYNGVQVPQMPERMIGDAIRLLSVGSLTPKKDHAILIRALAKLPPSYTLTIVGNGRLRGELEQLAQQVRVVDRITFLGAVDPKDMPAMYLKHDIFVLPSEREGCPNVVLEAQSFALPTIAFNIPGMNEFVVDGTGVLIKERNVESLSSAIGTLATDRERIREMGHSAYTHVTNMHSFDRHMDQLCAYLES